VDAAGEAAARLGGAVALKILSPDITHKSDLGGVVLDLRAPEQVRAAAAAMLERIRAARPQARLEGFTVQEMAPTQDATELIVGVVDDALFGPVLLFGHGGVAVEVLQDKALALPPLNLHLARDMMARTRVYSLLKGYRAKPPADLDAIAVTLMRVAQLVVDCPEIAELDINPLLARADGVLALDARIRVAKPALPGSARLAIRPYPKRLEKTVTTRVGMEVLVRPVRPEDDALLQRLVESTSVEDLRLRFFAPLKRLSTQLLARLSQLDYDREMALIALTGDGEPLGVVRIIADPDNREAEYAVLVRSDLKGHGLGWLLMNEIIAYARERGIGAIVGKVLEENVTMLRMAEELGFHRSRDPDDPTIVDVRVELAPTG
jgi:acetyltransferase